MKVDGEKLRLFRLAMRWQQTEFAEVLGTVQPLLSNMESGLRPVPEHVAAKFLFLTGFSPAYLGRAIQVDVPIGSDLWYRKRKEKFRKTDQSHAYCQLVFDVFEPMVRDLKPRKSTFTCLDHCSPEEAAGHVRNIFGLRPGVPIVGLVNHAERSGVRIVGVHDSGYIRAASNDVGQAEGDENQAFEAFSFWTHDSVPVIFVRSDLPPDRLNWAVAHDLIHLVMHRGHRGDIQTAEAEAQSGTEELLLPEAELIAALSVPGLSVRHMTLLASRWNVSLQSIVIRAAKLGIITEMNKRYYMGAIKRGAGDEIVVHAKGPTFYRQMCEALFGKPINVGEVCKRTGASRDFIREVLLANGATEAHLSD